SISLNLYSRLRVLRSFPTRRSSDLELKFSDFPIRDWAVMHVTIVIATDFHIEIIVDAVANFDTLGWNAQIGFPSPEIPEPETFKAQFQSSFVTDQLSKFVFILN